MQLVKIILPFFENGEPKYLAGEFYPPSDELNLCVAAGTAELVDVSPDLERAAQLADKATAAAERAVQKAEEANDAANAAEAAQALADQAAAAERAAAEAPAPEAPAPEAPPAP